MGGCASSRPPQETSRPVVRNLICSCHCVRLPIPRDTSLHDAAKHKWTCSWSTSHNTALQAFLNEINAHFLCELIASFIGRTHKRVTSLVCDACLDLSSLPQCRCRPRDKFPGLYAFIVGSPGVGKRRLKNQLYEMAIDKQAISSLPRAPSAYGRQQSSTNVSRVSISSTNLVSSHAAPSGTCVTFDKYSTLFTVATYRLHDFPIRGDINTDLFEKTTWSPIILVYAIDNMESWVHVESIYNNLNSRCVGWQRANAKATGPARNSRTLHRIEDIHPVIIVGNKIDLLYETDDMRNDPDSVSQSEEEKTVSVSEFESINMNMNPNRRRRLRECVRMRELILQRVQRFVKDKRISYLETDRFGLGCDELLSQILVQSWLSHFGQCFLAGYNFEFWKVADFKGTPCTRHNFWNFARPDQLRFE